MAVQSNHKPRGCFSHKTVQPCTSTLAKYQLTCTYKYYVVLYYSKQAKESHIAHPPALPTVRISGPRFSIFSPASRRAHTKQPKKKSPHLAVPQSPPFHHWRKVGDNEPLDDPMR